jgi:hypothetical protein
MREKEGGKLAGTRNAFCDLFWGEAGNPAREARRLMNGRAGHEHGSCRVIVLQHFDADASQTLT